MEILNRAFASKLNNRTVTTLPDLPPHHLDTFPQFMVTENAVRAALLELSPNKACGPDNLSAKIIRECADQLVSPLSKICGKSVETGVFPSLWKRANIIPLPKEGDRKNPKIAYP